MKIIDVGNSNVYKSTVKDTFMYEGGSWTKYFNKVKTHCMYSEDVVFELEDIDRSIFILCDGSEIIKLKDGRYFEVCWRDYFCRVWKVTNLSILQEIYNLEVEQ